MRSSNKRSRSKNNRNRQPSGGNIVNRVFDSSGPEGKVRGTPQQIIDKYNQLTRDAQLSGDRVAAENFAQHAEHYTRMLAEAQREIEAKREQHEQRQQNNNNQNNNQNQSSNNQNQQGGQPQQGGQDDGGKGDQSGQDNGQQADQSGGQQAGDGQDDGQQRKPRNRRKPVQRDTDVIDTKDGDDEDNLVETPENAPKPKRTRKPRQKAADTAAEGGQGDGADTAAE
ncbi:DUF4167 domain-containing protein [Palleronia pelagia]|uniref:DUF4167 domain-containing protein n=1 Tax=Palleronia pelagia TaxID=387096 RepID=A0A1H8AZN8_9RHOB|nr:DUF4167 domain-containing protein [Palleronia pelagia]SEM76182.1 protein of unknown function [Palleronia pelagia]